MKTTVATMNSWGMMKDSRLRMKVLMRSSAHGRANPAGSTHSLAPKSSYDVVLLLSA